jgi:F-type H+-transporting ATPase subunit b
MPATQMLAMTEGAGGLFDFNATLPLMAIQFTLLSVVLTFLFYKPVSKVIDEREEYINDNLTTASEKLIKADELYSKYDEQLKAARVSAQAIIVHSEKEAKVVADDEINQARRDAAELIKRTTSKLAEQKTFAIEQLESESQVDALSELVERKLLGDKLVFKREILKRYG